MSLPKKITQQSEIKQDKFGRNLQLFGYVIQQVNPFFTIKFECGGILISFNKDRNKRLAEKCNFKSPKQNNHAFLISSNVFPHSGERYCIIA